MLNNQNPSITSLLQSTILFLSAMLMIAICTSGALAYSIDLPATHFRLYENGDHFYRTNFRVWDEYGARVNQNVVSNVAVTNADTGESIDIAFSHRIRQRIRGWYDSGTAGFVYDSGFSEMGFHRADTDMMPAGNYDLTAEFIDGTSETVAFSYGGLTSMPQIYASDFIQSFNDQGDLEFNWTSHDLSGLTDPYYRLQIKSVVNGEIDRDIFIRIDGSLNQVTIPKDVLDQLQGADSILGHFSLRTIGNRTYTSDFHIDYTPVPAPASIWFLAAGLAGTTLLGRRRRKL